MLQFRVDIPLEFFWIFVSIIMPMRILFIIQLIIFIHFKIVMILQQRDLRPGPISDIFVRKTLGFDVGFELSFRQDEEVQNALWKFVIFRWLEEEPQIAEFQSSFWILQKGAQIDFTEMIFFVNCLYKHPKWLIYP